MPLSKLFTGGVEASRIEVTLGGVNGLLAYDVIITIAEHDHRGNCDLMSTPGSCGRSLHTTGEGSTLLV